MTNQFIELIKTRRSCRCYKSEQISDSQLNAVLEAGTYAPTAHGKQDPVIVVVQEPRLMQRLADMNAKVRGVAGNPYYDAPTYVLVFASEDNANAFQDGSCVLENMMLAAHALGLGSCWINREHEMFDTEEGKQLMREMGLKEGLIGIGALSLGLPAKEPKPAKERKDGWIKVIR